MLKVSVTITLYKHPSIPSLFVTADGQIFKRMPPRADSNGYSTVTVSYGTAPKTVRRGVLVLEALKGPRPEGHVVRHLNGKSSDDSIKNLAWGTQKQNMHDAVLHGTTTKGVKNKHAKLDEAGVLEIRHRFSDGESGSMLAEDFGVSHSTICDIIARRTWGWLK
jgi:hypothetical protein